MPVNPAASVLSTVINGLGVIQGGGAIEAVRHDVLRRGQHAFGAEDCLERLNETGINDVHRAQNGEGRVVNPPIF